MIDFSPTAREEGNSSVSISGMFTSEVKEELFYEGSTLLPDVVFLQRKNETKDFSNLYIVRDPIVGEVPVQPKKESD